MRRTPSSTRVTVEVDVTATSVLTGSTTGSEELHAVSAASNTAPAATLDATTPTDGLAARRLLIGQSVRGAVFEQADHVRATRKRGMMNQ